MSNLSPLGKPGIVLPSVGDGFAKRRQIRHRILLVKRLPTPTQYVRAPAPMNHPYAAATRQSTHGARQQTAQRIAQCNRNITQPALMADAANCRASEPSIEFVGAPGK